MAPCDSKRAAMFVWPFFWARNSGVSQFSPGTFGYSPGFEEDSDEVISPVSSGLKQTALPAVNPGSSPKKKFHRVQVSIGSCHLKT